MINLELEILTVKFNFNLRSEEIVQFRGAINKSLKHYSDNYHNHNGSGFHYRYPLIQYKKIANCGGIIFIGEAITDFHVMVGGFGNNARIGNRFVNMDIDYLRSKKTVVRGGSKKFYYKLNNWLPLNQDNYLKFSKLLSVTQKIHFLERILLANVLSFLEGIGSDSEERVTISLIEIEKEKSIAYKGQHLKCYDLVFQTNLFLPNYIGLGKGVSVGMGNIKEIKNYKPY